MKSFQDWLDREPAGPKPKKPLKRTGIRRPAYVAGMVNVIKRTTRIAPIGAKAKRERPALRKAVLEHLTEHPTCQLGPVIKAAGFEVLCLDTAVCVHHTRGRGKYLCDKTTFLSACAGECHLVWVHTTHVKEAYELGLLLPR